MAYTLPNDQKINVSVTYYDAKGNEVDIAPGSVVWETSDTTICTATVDTADDQMADIFGVDNGNAQVTVTATNLDNSTVISTLDITVVSGSAVTGQITPTGPAVPQAAK